METITIKMEERMLKEIDSKLKNNRYSTRTEFIRDSIRSKLSEIEKNDATRIKLSPAEKEKLMEHFRKNLGVLKGKAKMSEEEAGERAIQKLAQNFNIKLD